MPCRVCFACLLPAALAVVGTGCGRDRGTGEEAPTAMLFAAGTRGHREPIVVADGARLRVAPGATLALWASGIDASGVTRVGLRVTKGSRLSDRRLPHRPRCSAAAVRTGGLERPR